MWSKHSTLLWSRPVEEVQTDEGSPVISYSMSHALWELQASAVRRPATVKPWFNGKIDFSPPTPDLRDQGFPLVGGRLDYIGGRVVPAIVYSRKLHTINVFAWPAGKGPSAGTMATDGYTLVHWRQGDLDFWAVSDVAGGDLEQFHQAFVAAAR